MVLTVETMIVGSVPAICMLAFTILGLGIKVPDNIAGALQHFAAGLLLSAIGTELLPILLDAEGFDENLYATIGFFAGMATLIVLGILLPEAHSHDDDDDHDDDDSNIRQHSSVNRSLRSLQVMAAPGGSERAMTKSMSLRQTAKKINDDYNTSCDTCTTAGVDVNHVHKAGAGEARPLLSERGGTESKDVVKAMEVVEKALPMSFLAAIVVDSFMDGFLIGITGAAGPGTVIIMAGSLSVEMGFVGLTLATACHGMPYSKAIPAALAGPITLVLGALVGGLVTTQIEGNPAMLAGIMGFGTSALLFMVAEELLLEAHEDGDDHVWWVDMQLYTGFYWGFMSTKFLPE